MTEFYFEDVSIEDVSGVLTARVDDVHKSNVLLGSIIAMQESHREQLLVPPDVSQYVPPEPPKRRAAAKRKTAPKGKAKAKAKRKVPAKKRAKSKTDRSKFAGRK